MADVKISLLTDATTVGGTDEFPIVQGGVTKRATVSELKTGLALTKSDVGLGNVDNTSDANKPVSTAQQTALDGKSATSHTHLLAAGATDVTITAANLNTLDDGTNTTLHFHDSDRSRSNHTGTQTANTISDFSTAADARIAAASVNALADVVVTTPSTGQVLKYNGTNWVNDTDATGGGGGALDDLTDVTITTPSTGQVLKYNGSAWVNDTDATGGGGSVTITGTPANNQLAIWTGSSAIEGDSSLTYDGTSLNLATAKNFQIAGATVLADAAGTTTLSNIDALDATTEATIEAAIDTLANLTSIQGRTVTLADAGADAFLGWDDSANAYENLTSQEASDILLAVAPTVVVESTTARTLAASDNGKIIRCTNAAATTITVPTAFSTFGCTIVRAGTGIVTIAASSTTLNGGSLVLNGQYLAASILPTGTANTFDVIGATGGVDKLDATSNPTTGDDSADGYGVGSKWVNLTADTVYFCTDASVGAAVWVLATGGAGVSDGDKGDITVSGSGATYTIDNGVVTLAKMANLAQDQVIGRTTASTGVPETFTVTAAARTVLDDTTTGAMLTTLSAAARSQTTCGISFSIPTVANQDYIIVLKAPHGGTITETTSKCTSGTATATFKINTTALGGTANSVSSTEQSQAQASANVFAADDDIVVTMSANSSCLGAAFTIKYTRTLA